MDELNAQGELDRPRLTDHSQPARRAWLTWAASLLFLAAAVAVPFAYRWLSRPEGFAPTRQHNGRTEVFLRNPRAWDGEWLPLVEATSSPLLYLVHQGVPPGSVAHINEDGTVLITDNEAGNLRAKRQAELGLCGWPPP